MVWGDTKCPQVWWDLQECSATSGEHVSGQTHSERVSVWVCECYWLDFKTTLLEWTWQTPLSCAVNHTHKDTQSMSEAVFASGSQMDKDRVSIFCQTSGSDRAMCQSVVLNQALLQQPNLTSHSMLERLGENFDSQLETSWAPMRKIKCYLLSFPVCLFVF